MGAGIEPGRQRRFAIGRRSEAALAQQLQQGGHAQAAIQVLVQQHFRAGAGQAEQMGVEPGLRLQRRGVRRGGARIRAGLRGRHRYDASNYRGARRASLAILPWSAFEPTPPEPVPAVIYDMGGKFDKSFNQAAYDGAERWKKETGKPYLEFEISNEAQREQACAAWPSEGRQPHRRRRLRAGLSIEKVAKDFPKLQFAIIDSVVKLPNVQSIVFKEHEGSFLVGMMAAMASKTGKVGFVGGMDIPLIRKFQCGYEQGAKYANPKAEVTPT
jgi:hypothetical protein